LGFLPKEKKDKIKRFIKYEDALMSLTAEILIRAVVCSKLGIKNESVKFNRTTYGSLILKAMTIFILICHIREVGGMCGKFQTCWY